MLQLYCLSWPLFTFYQPNLVSMINLHIWRRRFFTKIEQTKSLFSDWRFLAFFIFEVVVLVPFREAMLTAVLFPTVDLYPPFFSRVSAKTGGFDLLLSSSWKFSLFIFPFFCRFKTKKTLQLNNNNKHTQIEKFIVFFYFASISSEYSLPLPFMAWRKTETTIKQNYLSQLSLLN